MVERPKEASVRGGFFCFAPCGRMGEVANHRASEDILDNFGEFSAFSLHLRFATKT
jgi:hypothetical protein